MLAAFAVVLSLMLPEIKFDNLMATPIDKGFNYLYKPCIFHGVWFPRFHSSLNKYLDGNVKALRLLYFGRLCHNTLLAYSMATIHARLAYTK